MRRLKVLCRWSHSHHTRRQRGSVLCAVECAQQFLFLREFSLALLQQHCLAALHVHRAAHAAIAIAETQRHSGKRAAKKHEHKEQGCESRLHLYSGTLLKTTNESQRFKSSRTKSRNFPAKSMPYLKSLIFAPSLLVLRKSTLGRAQIL